MNKKILFSIIAILALVVIGEVIYFSLADKKQPKITATTAKAEGIKTDVVMYKNPNCGCCDMWAEHMQQAGFTVVTKPTPLLMAFKKEHGVPLNVASCHTAIIDGYVVEGHVPAADVIRLLKERPDAVGLAVPGMPQGSPGMPSLNPEPFKVYLVGNNGQLQVFAEHGQS